MDKEKISPEGSSGSTTAANSAPSLGKFESVNKENNKNDCQKDFHGSYLQPRKYLREKFSYGIACTRFSAGKPQILLMCKRYTYAYNTFVHGRYNSCDNSQLMKLFDKMTVEEKINICSMSFQQIWHKIYLNVKHRRAVYFSAKSKFESTFAIDDGAKLRKMIGKSRSSKCIWEIPKGRKGRNECDVSAAVREFREETGIQKGRYKLDQDVVFKQDYVDENVRYRNFYFFAYTPEIVEPKIDMSSEEQLKEVSEIQWMTIEDVRRVDHTGFLGPFVEKIFRLLRARSKKMLI